MNVKKIKTTEIKDGDIIFVDLDLVGEDNSHMFGDDWLLAGGESVFIIDDSSLSFCYEFIINGGNTIYLNKDTDVYLIGHFSDLLKNIENL